MCNLGGSGGLSTFFVFQGKKLKYLESIFWICCVGDSSDWAIWVDERVSTFDHVSISRFSVGLLVAGYRVADTVVVVEVGVRVQAGVVRMIYGDGGLDYDGPGGLDQGGSCWGHRQGPGNNSRRGRR